MVPSLFGGLDPWGGSDSFGMLQAKAQLKEQQKAEKAAQKAAKEAAKAERVNSRAWHQQLTLQKVIC